MPELSTKQSSYSNSTFSSGSPDYHIIFILIWTFLHKKLRDVINRLNEGTLQILQFPNENLYQNSVMKNVWNILGNCIKTWVKKFTNI